MFEIGEYSLKIWTKEYGVITFFDSRCSVISVLLVLLLSDSLPLLLLSLRCWQKKPEWGQDALKQQKSVEGLPGEEPAADEEEEEEEEEE